MPTWNSTPILQKLRTRAGKAQLCMCAEKRSDAGEPCTWWRPSNYFFGWAPPKVSYNALVEAFKGSMWSALPSPSVWEVKCKLRRQLNVWTIRYGHPCTRPQYFAPRIFLVSSLWPPGDWLLSPLSRNYITESKGARCPQQCSYTMDIGELWGLP